MSRKAERAARGNDALERRAAGVGGAENTAHTGSRDMEIGIWFCSSTCKNPEMREAARETLRRGRGPRLVEGARLLNFRSGGCAQNLGGAA